MSVSLQKPPRRWGWVLLGLTALLAPRADAQTRTRPPYDWTAPLNVRAAVPAPRSIGASPATPIVLTFDKPVDPTSFVPNRTFWAFGRWSGAAVGTIAFSPDLRSVGLLPDTPFSAGELVMVIVANTVRGADGSAFRPQGFSYQFWVGTKPAEMNFEQTCVMSTRTDPLSPTKSYGGIATDLDEDGLPDISITNEVTSDLRVFLNTGNGPAPYGGFMEPTAPLGNRASPSEPSDFNADGHADITVANTQGGSISVLLGNGDGTFQPQQLIQVGANPRGVVVLDVDADGDTDLVNTNSLSSQFSILFNDGNGVFSAPTFVDTPTNGVWGAWAQDMNEDGVLDLVIGSNSGQELLVYAGHGDGTFSLVSQRSAGGAVWMVVGGDVNGDGHEDVGVANGLSNFGSILFGDGQGNLSDPVVYATDPWATALDLADLDGDNDLDAIWSAYFGNWKLYENTGGGTLSYVRDFQSPAAASCSLAMDVEGDGDLDLALIDEEEDLVLIQENRQMGEVRCDDLRGIAWACDGDDLVIRVFLNDMADNGRRIQIEVAGIVHGATVVGDVARFTLRDVPHGPSAVVRVVEPADCPLSAVVVTCP